MIETNDIRDALTHIGVHDTDDSMAQAALILALSSIARHLDRIYDRMAHIEERLERLQ